MEAFHSYFFQAGQLVVHTNTKKHLCFSWTQDSNKHVLRGNGVSDPEQMTSRSWYFLSWTLCQESGAFSFATVFFPLSSTLSLFFLCCICLQSKMFTVCYCGLSTSTRPLLQKQRMTVLHHEKNSWKTSSQTRMKCWCVWKAHRGTLPVHACLLSCIFWV